MWTYEDWLYGTISPEWWTEENKPHSLYYILYNGLTSGKLKREELDKINKSQLETWENALELNFQKWKEKYDNSIAYLVTDQNQYRQLEIQIIQDEINLNKKTYQDTFLIYKRDIYNITGIEYEEIRVLKARGVEEYFELNIPEEDKINFRMHLARKKLEYIQGYRSGFIIPENLIEKLFENYGDEFPDEVLESWKSRFLRNDNVLPKLKIHENIKGNENNRLLIVTILLEMENYLYSLHLLPKQYNVWVKKRFGFDYSSIKSRCKGNEKFHSKAKQIRDLFNKMKEFAMT